MKTETQAVADAFKTVSGDARYCGRWIQDSDYAAVIRLIYGLQSDHLLSHNLLNKSLSRDRRFKTARDCTFGNGAGTFRDDYTPKVLADGSNNNRGRIFCYFVTDAGESRPETTNGESWYDTMKPFRLCPRPRLQILDDCQNELQTLPVRTDKASQLATTPSKNVHQQLQADVNYVTTSLSGKKSGLTVSASSQRPSSTVDGPEASQHASSIVDALELMFGKLINVLQLKFLELPAIPTMHGFALRNSVTTSANSL
jgi:hypothetical protein